MSTERDELAKVIVAAYGEDAEAECPCEQDLDVAEAILAAGYRKPRQVTTVEELKALEDPETVLVDFKQNAYQWGIGLDGSEGWQSTRDPNPITSDHLLRFMPLTVLFEGSL